MLSKIWIPASSILNYDGSRRSKQGGKKTLDFLPDCAVNPLIGPFGAGPRIAARNRSSYEKETMSVSRPTSRKTDGRHCGRRGSTSSTSPNFTPVIAIRPAPAKATFASLSCPKSFPASRASNAIVSSTSFSRTNLLAVSTRWRCRQWRREKPCQRAELTASHELQLPSLAFVRPLGSPDQMLRHRLDADCRDFVAALAQNLEPIAMKREYLTGLGNCLRFVNDKAGDRWSLHHRASPNPNGD